MVGGILERIGMMRWPLVGLILAFLLTTLCVARAADASLAPNPMITTAYIAPKNPAFEHYYTGLQKRRVLEELRVFLSPLKLPSAIAVTLDQCDAPNRLYSPGGPVVICYEYVDKLNQLAAGIPADGSGPFGVKRDDAVVGAFIQATLQRTASAVFDVLDTPIWGREQDAADKLAAFLMMQFGQQYARKLMIGAAYFFEASDRTWSGADFARESATQAQRYYNYLCIAYGYDPALFSDISEQGATIANVSHPEALLPASRVPWCPKEYNDAKRAFALEIGPFIDSGKLAEVLRRDWLKPFEE